MYILLIKDKNIYIDNMIDKLYLTENIFLLNDKLYYEKNKNIQEVKNHNWHRLLNEYGWEKLNKNWIKKLNQYLDKPNNNSLFGSLDCGGDGDCLFHCLSYAVKGVLDDFDSKSLRSKLSDSITIERFSNIIEIYKILSLTGDFDEDWDPNTITFDEFKEKLIEGGNEYWGDFLLLNLLKEILNINFVILYSNEYLNKYYNYPLFYEYDENIKTIILLYENEEHFKLIGNFQSGNMIYLFTHKTIPREILKIINYLR